MKIFIQRGRDFFLRRRRVVTFATLFVAIALLVVTVAFLCWVAINERPALTRLRSLEFLVNPALLLLVVFLLLIPALWILLFHSQWVNKKGLDREDLLAWATSMSVPYLILGFAMLLEFRSVIEEPAAGIGAIAAIMVLYALSLLASFLYLEVRDLKKTFSEKMSEANRWYSYSLSLSSAEDGQPSPGESIEDLLSTWKRIYTTDDHRPLASRSRLRRNALGTLLHTYMKEEAANARGQLALERVPESVWPWSRDISEKDNEGVSFLITNIGYYANLLRQSAHFLPGAVENQAGIFLATITYALPPLWWNWQSIEGDAYAYPQIEHFRDTLQSLTGDIGHPRMARVFRKIIVADGWKSDHLFSREHWESMKNWQFLMREDGRPASSKYVSLPREHYDQSSGDGSLVKNLRWTKGEKTEGKRRHAYWIVDESARPVADFDFLLVGHYFSRYMHLGRAGLTEIVPISREIFEGPILANEESGLSGCSELLFFGACSLDSQDAWAAQSPELAMAVLTTMSPVSETMFVTAVWGEERLAQLWRATANLVTKRFPEHIFRTN